VLSLSGIRWPAVGEGREWGKLIGGGDSDCRWEAAICESKSCEVERDRPVDVRPSWWAAEIGGGRRCCLVVAGCGGGWRGSL
jgi:hypothetical protein